MINIEPTPDPTARICYSFMQGDINIRGEIDCRRTSVAKAVVAELNETFGPGTHWVVPDNMTEDERRERALPW